MTQTATPEASSPEIQPRTAPSPQGQGALFDLLARSWHFDAPVTGIALDAAGKAAGFALADGRLALAPLEDAESPLKRLRVEGDSGRSLIRPREKPASAPILTPELARGAPMLAVSGVIGLIAASADGRIHRVTPRGQAIPLATPLAGPDAPILALASDRGGRLAIARDGRVDLHDEVRMGMLDSIAVPGEVRAMAFAPDDRALAVMLDDSLLLVRPDGACQSWPLGGAGPLAFSPRGDWLAGGNGRDGFWLLRRKDGACAQIGRFRTAPLDIAFSKAADAVFASGAFRAAGWSLDTPPLDAEATGALRTGRAGLVLIDRIAAHPGRDLVALGMADGAVSIARAGQPEELALRPSDGAAITALAWSACGLHLAIGTAAGQAALVTLPPQLFK